MTMIMIDYTVVNLVYRITCKYCTPCIANVVTPKDLSPLCFPGHLHSARHCERGGSTAPCDWPVMACHHILATAAARERPVGSLTKLFRDVPGGVLRRVLEVFERSGKILEDRALDGSEEMSCSQNLHGFN